MTAQRFRGPVLPDGEARDLYVVDGRITYEPQAGADTVAEGWIVPGLVDAHCHLGLDDFGATDDAATEQQAIADRDGGALLIRDAGSAADTALDPRPRRPAPADPLRSAHRRDEALHPRLRPRGGAGRPGVVRRPGGPQRRRLGQAGRRLDLARRGRPRPVVPCGGLRRRHRRRARRGCQGDGALLRRGVLPGLIEAGIDCIEHGTGLTEDLIDAMVQHGTRLVPTVMQLDKFPEHAAAGQERFPAYAEHMVDLYDRMPATIMAAYEAGVPIYAGSDAGASAATATSRARSRRSADRDAGPTTRSAPPAGGPGSGSGWTAWSRARRRTSSSTTATRAPTCPCCARPPRGARGRAVGG